MALTSYFNWETTLQADLNLETSSIFHDATPEEEVVLLAPDYYNHHHHHHHLLPYYYYENTTSSNFLYPPHDHLLPYEYDPLTYLHEDRYYYNYNDNTLPCPKRQKHCFSSYDQSLMEPSSNNFFDGIIGNNISVPNIPEFCNELDIPAVTNAAEGGCDGRKKINMVEKAVSAQSKAARERRRKITEKTQELGRLVPAASNMNTADMLHAAAKYLTYLKAQVHMLQLIHTLKEDKALSGSEDLQALLTSPFVEEKLYLQEKCFVPKEFVTTLTNHQDVQSRPSILQDLNQLIGTDTEKKEQQI